MRREFYYLSKDEKTHIHAVEWIPEGQIDAVLQICHGMVEHIERYNEFAEYLSARGIYVVGHDHLGHGKSVTDVSKMGYFSETNGNACVVNDIHMLRLITKDKYPDLPYFMMGHSMGSFLVRQYIGIRGRSLSGAIIMGTGDQPAVVLKAGQMLCKAIAAVRGWDHRSIFINNLSVGGYEKLYEGRGWLSRNAENIESYGEDPLCGFIFTLNGFYNMFTGMLRMTKQEKERRISKTLPVFFVAGSEDPVGDNGKGVEAVYQRYLKNGMKDVEIKLYEGDRHEIIAEDDKVQVFEDILKWIKKRI